ncbi:MAG: hypothetical protein QOF11_103 [Chloroflexota bacterium]|jgi:hypothetical protein|nr:hypothetical protein [Chloroflexota bacterium]
MIRYLKSLLGLVVAGAIAVGCTSAAGPSGQPGKPTGAASPAPSAAAASLPIPSDFPLGSWTSTITAEQLRAGGVPEDLLKENAGTFTQTFNPDGTWISSQVSTDQVNLPVFRGTFRITGDHQFEQTTTFPPEYAGDIVRFTWQLDKGALSLRVPNPPDPMLKVITESNLWQAK